MKEFNVKSDYDGMRLDRYIQKTCRDIPKGAVMKLIRKGDVKLNGKKAVADARISEGDNIKIYAVTEEFTLKVNSKLPYPEILYEDDFLLFVNKPAGLCVYKTERNEEDTLTERVKNYLKKAIEESEGRFVPGSPMRLDINTSGIVIFAKTAASAAKLSELSREGKINKTYTALVIGDFNSERKITTYGQKDTKTNVMKLSNQKSENAVKMVSIVKPLARYRFTQNAIIKIKSNEIAPAALSMVNVTLITGKTHQIRSQLSFCSYPVAGDMKYGDKDLNIKLRQRYNLKRQFLHCSKVGLTLWYDGGSTITVSSPLPEDLGFVKL